MKPSCQLQNLELIARRQLAPFTLSMMGCMPPRMPPVAPWQRFSLPTFSRRRPTPNRSGTRKAENLPEAMDKAVERHLEVPIEEPLAAEVVDANMAMERNFDAMMAALSLSDLTAQPQHWNQPFCFKMQIGDLSLRFLLVRGQFQTCQCLPSQLNLTSSMPPLLESRPVTS